MAFEEDKSTLNQILGYTDDLLEELTGRVKTEQARFRSAWAEVKNSIKTLIGRISTIASEADNLWSELKERGLTGAQLALKRALLAAASNAGICGKILKVLNILLGSIPGAEAVKEYKELLEDNLENLDAPVNAKFS